MPLNSASPLSAIPAGTGPSGTDSFGWVVGSQSHVLDRVTSRTAVRVLVGGVLGYLAGSLLVDGGFDIAWAFDASSWADGLPGPLIGIFGGGSSGSGPKPPGVYSSDGKPSIDSGSDEPPTLEKPAEDELPPGLPEEDETSYRMFDKVHDLLGKVLGEDYDDAQKRWKESQREDGLLWPSDEDSD